MQFTLTQVFLRALKVYLHLLMVCYVLFGLVLQISTFFHFGVTSCMKCIFFYWWTFSDTMSSPFSDSMQFLTNCTCHPKRVFNLFHIYFLWIFLLYMEMANMYVFFSFLDFGNNFLWSMEPYVWNPLKIVAYARNIIFFLSFMYVIF